MMGNSLLLTTLPPTADRSSDTAQAAMDRSATSNTGTGTFDQIMASANGEKAPKSHGSHHAASHVVKHTEAAAATPLLTKAPAVTGKKKAADAQDVAESEDIKVPTDLALLLGKKTVESKKPATPEQDAQAEESALTEAEPETDVNQTEVTSEVKAATTPLISDALLAQLLAPPKPESPSKVRALKGNAQAEPVGVLAAETKSAATPAPTVASTSSQPIADVVTQAKNRPAKATVKLTVTPVEDESASKPPAPDAIVQNAKDLPTSLTGAKNSHGTGGALIGSQMRFNAETDENAGSTTQKVPVMTSRSPLAVKAETGGEDLSSFDRPSGQASVSGSSAGTTALSPEFQTLSVQLDVTAGKAASVSQSSATHTAAQQVETLGRMVNQHVALLHQSGANNISLSLKLDSQTELNLQLTSHNGQVEAALRFERGSVPGMDAHWRDLQDSLAKQNVQLLPLDTRSVPRISAGSSTSDNQTSYSQQERSAQYSQQQGREARREYVSVADWQTSVSVKPQTTKTRSAQGWEALA